MVPALTNGSAEVEVILCNISRIIQIHTVQQVTCNSKLLFLYFRFIKCISPAVNGAVD